MKRRTPGMVWFPIAAVWLVSAMGATDGTTSRFAATCCDPPRPLASPDFETQVIPVFTKSGCNSGSCHGAAIGRGGFKLSLLGYDPTADFDSLVRELEGRRVNQAHPERSLVLRKPSLDLMHDGGLRLDRGSDGFRIINDWIAAGVPRERTRSLRRIQVAPSSALLDAAGDHSSIQVTATFQADDREYDQDVTEWSVITASDPAAVTIDPQGAITVLRTGRHTVMVRFLGEVAAVTVSVPIGDPAISAVSRPRANFVDEYVNHTLDDLRLPHSPRSDDHTYLRRVFLDLIGTLPDRAEIDVFVNSNDADKRAAVVEQLLRRPEFVDLWSYKWGDWLHIESRRLQPDGAAAFHRWVRGCVERNTPLDEMCRSMLLATGDGYRIGAANFHRVPGDARSEAEHVSRVFMGVRLQCANCHNHPLDRWTQDDYHGLAEIFARIDRGREVKELPRGDVIHPKTGRPAVAKIPGGDFLDRNSAAQRGRTDKTGDGPFSDDAGPERSTGLPASQLCDWLTSPENPFLARAFVNRIWRELFGRGLVEPVDDHRATNPATHPELLDALSRDFSANGFDMRRVIRTIVASEAYQRSSQSVRGNEGDDRFYAKALVRTLPPPVLVDAVVKVTGIAEQLGELPAGTTAISLGDSRIPSEPLELLGRCARDVDCTANTVSAGSLPLTLHTINGPWLNSKINSPAGLVAQAARRSGFDREFIEDCYWRALSRSPSRAELDHWCYEIAVAAVERRAEVLEDFLWALLNCPEFCCNH